MIYLTIHQPFWGDNKRIYIFRNVANLVKEPVRLWSRKNDSKY